MELKATIDAVLKAFGLPPDGLAIERINAGHINRTYQVGQSHVLQRINKHVFRDPEILSENLRGASAYLKHNAPGYLFLHAIKTPKGDQLVYDGDGFPWRLFPYIKNTVTINEVGNARQAYAAARAFGLLARHLSGCDVSGFSESIPRFHDLSWRYQQFEESLQKGTPERKALAGGLIDRYVGHRHLVGKYNDLVQSHRLVLRPTHNDTKINNVLFDRDSQEVVCVIDLDTLMPGYFIYDLGDMVRSFVSPSAEDETDISKIEVRKEIHQAILDGYLSEMGTVLTDGEKEATPLAGPLMTYMIGLRFLTDFLNGDVYYHTSYPRQNLHRAMHQLYLLEKLGQ